MEKNKGFVLTEKEYFKNHGVDVMAFSDFYPAGHQSGVTLIMNGKRLAANGDVRFEATPGQWQPVPKQVNRCVQTENNTIVTHLEYPDMKAHLHGFNPILYPDFEFGYDVIVTGTEDGVEVIVNLDRPIAPEFAGKLCFSMDLFPGELFGKSYLCDDKTGIFPRQPNAPTIKKPSNYDHTGKMKPIAEARASREKLSGDNKGYNPLIADDIIAMPYAQGHVFTACPEDELMCFSVESMTGEVALYDGRMNHNNGWFVLSNELPENTTNEALHWIIRPRVNTEWMQKPTVQTSQVGYHPGESKKAYVELDTRDHDRYPIILEKINANGRTTLMKELGQEWGDFLRYRYLILDFSHIVEEGLYQITYKDSKSSVFRIAKDIYERGVWQPVLEYFLPVQMCHMRVNEKYRVWHGRCHCDDGRMAPTDYEQFDGAAQGPDTLTNFKSGDHIPNMNCGGWHDAGDFDLRIESQTGEMYILSAAYEEFGVDYDETTIDQITKTVEIHQPDGKNDILQQIEHGALTVVNGYRSLGRLYHEIMAGDLRQYVLLGDAVNMTSGIEDGPDERLVFTEDNPVRELYAAAHLAGSYRALKDLNPQMAKECLDIARELFDITKLHATVEIENDYEPLDHRDHTLEAKLNAACELFLSTDEEQYGRFVLQHIDQMLEDVMGLGWILCRTLPKLETLDASVKEIVHQTLLAQKDMLEKMCAETPYGIPYKPNVWGAGWGIQTMVFRMYFIHKVFPDVVSEDILFDALHFILGAHPGTNTASFASGVGAKSATVAYGVNRADYSYIPGGVISGTALIRPDLPELLEFPYLWQQTEYVLGGGSSNYMFLVLAVSAICNDTRGRG